MEREACELSWPRDAEPFHFRLQGGPFHRQSRGCSLWTADHPVSVTQRAQYVLPFRIVERDGGIQAVIVRGGRH